MSQDNFKSNRKIITRIVICAIVILIGVLGMSRLAKLKKSPAEVRYEEPSLRVEVLRAKTEDVPVFITGYGEVRALDVVSIAPEISGKVINIHPRLEAGEIVAKGDILFRVDPRDYEASFEEAAAMVRQLENSILRLKKQYEIDRERLKTLERNRDLAGQQYTRVKNLFENDKVGTLTGVDQAEQSFNSVSDQAEQMALAVDLYPIRIRESESSLASARARQKTAKSRFERCTVKAPFNGRVKQVSLEKGQYVSPGMSVVTLANDSILEIQVPLDSRDAAKWLRFNGEQVSGSSAWFNGLDRVRCKIRWTEAEPDIFWQGILQRVIKFDRQTRTLTVAVRVKAEEALSSNGNSLPLVEGMFCSIEIPGKILTNVVSLPRWAVSFENTVYLSIDNRLKTVPVEVARVEGENAFVSKGLKPGDTVITTRLINPLENSLLSIQGKKEQQGRDGAKKE
ncbi:efflux RND transporter periplasmic adaptor subunit [Thermodesulfobacteriota bacterium]